MPPKKEPRLSAEHQAALLTWTQTTLDNIALASAGDPGPVVLRRLSNMEYTYTLRDLTEIGSLDPAREFPVDGAAAEGFTNAGAALVMSPGLLTKYLDALQGRGKADGLSPKYLQILRDAFTGTKPSILLDPLRTKFREKKLSAADIEPWQQVLWRFASVGHIGKENGPKAGQEPVTPLVPEHEMRVKLTSGRDVTLYLTTTDAGDGSADDDVIWQKPRLVAPGRPDFPISGLPAFVKHLEEQPARIIANTEPCLNAIASGKEEADATVRTPGVMKAHSIATHPSPTRASVIGPLDGNHVCDLTAVNLTLSDGTTTWDLAKDVSPNILKGNPHGARHFLSQPATLEAAPDLPAPIAEWRKKPSAELAVKVRQFLEKDFPLNSPLLRPVLSDRSDSSDTSDITAKTPSVIEVKIPAALANGAEFVVTGQATAGGRT